MTPTVTQITTAVASAFDIRPDDITGCDRQRAFAYPRFVVCALAHEAGHSMPAIGARLRRDHTSVLSGIRRVVEISARDEAYAATVRDLRAALKPGMSITDRILSKVRAAQ